MMQVFLIFCQCRKKMVGYCRSGELAYGAFFINNKKKLKSDNLAVITDASGADSAEGLPPNC